MDFVETDFRTCGLERFWLRGFGHRVFYCEHLEHTLAGGLCLANLDVNLGEILDRFVERVDADDKTQELSSSGLGIREQSDVEKKCRDAE